MNKMNLIKVLSFLTVLLLFTSCGDKYYTDDFLRNSDDKLCGYTWVEELTYYNESNFLELQIQTLYFDRNGSGYGSGRHGFELYRALPGGKWENKPFKVETYAFNWKWIDNYEGLNLDYGGGKVSLFENVWVREFYLSGKFDNEELTFYRD